MKNITPFSGLSLSIHFHKDVHVTVTLNCFALIIASIKEIKYN